ncbi:uncharacterized protein C1orf131 isoform X1 [Nematostella vectensis]|uniref:uncharacterized protein C1orf131 isoform X1 n=1 Tax=Nematostella vectensis TaxID=45351 RepID=UPI0020779903|nr:uncharacterized protein C1orf131 isoform X1 [Nematostella vectensis]
MKEDVNGDEIREALYKNLKALDRKEVALNDGERTRVEKKKRKQTDPTNLQKAKKKKSSCEKSNQNISKACTNSGDPIRRPHRPPPIIIEFNEPGKSNKIRESHRDSRQRPRGMTENQSSDEDQSDFLSMARDVKEFGMTGFSKKERRKYEQQKAQSLGAKAPKGQKLPYKILMSVNKVKLQREKKKETMDRAMGMATKKKANKKDKTNTSNKVGGWWTDNSSKGFDLALGKYKGGVQRLSKDDIKRIRGSKR